MPDCHVGYGMPIGGVMATKEVVIPNAVGVDIGCGMCALQTSLPDVDTESLKNIMALIRQRVPLGFKHHKKRQDSNLMPKLGKGDLSSLEVVEREYRNALHQLGTLGGGNHFIEIQRGDDHRIWIMIHSGSRNLGYQVASHYNKLAVTLNAKWGSKIPPKWQLAYLPLDHKKGRQYLEEMQFCVEFALANRLLMMERVKDAFMAVLGPVRFGEIVNIAHNYAALEFHFRKKVMVHRKGATRATVGELGIIPGSQGTSSYIVRGLGNPESFFSCSHGAGRRMGRKQAQRQLNLEQEKMRLQEQGIIHAIRGRRDLEEAAGAYKDVEEVVENQFDLVEVVVRLRPLAVIKG
jgi:tRNA-splicing ligase RtcB